MGFRYQRMERSEMASRASGTVRVVAIMESLITAVSVERWPSPGSGGIGRECYGRDYIRG